MIMPKTWDGFIADPVREDRIVQGPVTHTWTWIFGCFKIGSHKIQTGNSVYVFALRNSKWARVRLLDDYLVRIIDAKSKDKGGSECHSRKEIQTTGKN